MLSCEGQQPPSHTGAFHQQPRNGPITTGWPSFPGTDDAGSHHQNLQSPELFLGELRHSGSPTREKVVYFQSPLPISNDHILLIRDARCSVFHIFQCHTSPSAMCLQCPLNPTTLGEDAFATESKQQEGTVLNPPTTVPTLLGQLAAGRALPCSELPSLPQQGEGARERDGVWLAAAWHPLLSWAIIPLRDLTQW